MLAQQEEKTKNPLPFGICVIVFRHQVSFFDFSPFWNDYLYYIEDDRLNDPKEWNNLKTFAEIFVSNILKADKSDKSIFVIDYSPVSALCLKGYMKFPRANPNRFFCLSFFHDDQTTSNIYTEFDDKTTSKEYLMDIKFKIIESMINFPFIKKYEIPIGFEISAQYLTDIINELL